MKKTSKIYLPTNFLKFSQISGTLSWEKFFSYHTIFLNRNANKRKTFLDHIHPFCKFWVNDQTQNIYKSPVISPVMASWESISGREAYMSEIIIASVISWKQLSTSSRSILCIIQSETYWGKFHRSLILRFSLMLRRTLMR